ncbi:hypothetical protein [Undibacterium sp.]|jgi:hypothetical protein|uniref:hypothetical protein n=1 Tax=Undibacterium sp. TaxID=1914977 RepID=UPI002C41A859|nr:hypothetical protein [Undibacterium sp.]HTD02674.1 hypothetical protein [Undibacterium sp.]
MTMPSNEIVEQLEKQLRFLERSAKAYDEGEHDDAIRIATSIRVICHQTSNSTSLLSMLGASGINLLSTSQQELPGPGLGLNVANNLMFDVMKMTLTAAPMTSDVAHRMIVSFDGWWNREVVFFNNETLQITRRDLVLWLANKDGGAHVEVPPPARYKVVQDGMNFTWTLGAPGGVEKKVQVSEFQLAALRQFAYELLNSPELLTLAGRQIQ